MKPQPNASTSYKCLMNLDFNGIASSLANVTYEIGDTFYASKIDDDTYRIEYAPNVTTYMCSTRFEKHFERQ